jgi:hypothetical protein
VVAGTVYVGSDDGFVYSIDAQTGTKRWAYNTEGVLRSSPAIVNGTVYIGSHDGNLYALTGGNASDSGVAVIGDETTTDGDGQYVGDGRHQDINGDGSVTLADVTGFFNRINSDAVQNNVSLFDFNGDGRVTPSDVTTLFNQVAA